MIKIIIAIVFALLGSGMMILSEVMTSRIETIKTISRSYKEEVADLVKIEKTNLWIKKQDRIGAFDKWSDVKTAETAMISFYDSTPKNVGLKINRYIYKDVDLKMDMLFNAPILSANDLYQVFALNNAGGVVKFNNVNIKQGEVSGDITLIQTIGSNIDAIK